MSCYSRWMHLYKVGNCIHNIRTAARQMNPLCAISGYFSRPSLAYSRKAALDLHRHAKSQLTGELYLIHLFIALLFGFNSLTEETDGQIARVIAESVRLGICGSAFYISSFRASFSLAPPQK